MLPRCCCIFCAPTPRAEYRSAALAATGSGGCDLRGAGGVVRVSVMARIGLMELLIIGVPIVLGIVGIVALMLVLRKKK